MNLEPASRTKLKRWLKEDSPEVEGYIIKSDTPRQYKLVKTKVNSDKPRKGVFSTFHTHPKDCDLNDANCGKSPPSSIDMTSFYKMASKGLRKHVIFGIEDTWVIVCKPCDKSQRHITRLANIAPIVRGKPNEYSTRWKKTATSMCTCCKVSRKKSMA